MPSEKSMWGELRPLLKGLDPVRVENMVQVGTPDINYTLGWIELKYEPNWPKRGGPLRVDHFTKEQRAWITRRVAHLGKVFLLLKVAEEWLLFEGTTAALHLGDSDKETLYELALVHWPRKPTMEELQLWL
jgi:hypothetical protein